MRSQADLNWKISQKRPITTAYLYTLRQFTFTIFRVRGRFSPQCPWESLTMPAYLSRERCGPVEQATEGQSTARNLRLSSKLRYHAWTASTMSVWCPLRCPATPDGGEGGGGATKMYMQLHYREMWFILWFSRFFCTTLGKDGEPIFIIFCLQRDWINYVRCRINLPFSYWDSY